MLNNYETIYILKPDVTEDMNLTLANKYKSLVKENGGQNVFVQHKGRRHLSYNVTNYYDGIYIQMNYDANGSIVKLLQKSMRFDDQIIRCLTVRQDLLKNINL
uniref:ribosomal protein S6 n=1 Tax=Pachymeniopsis lanceolata TaxID=151733 RepID=UPI002A812B24|nr:ribosomal protein S6 [Pachymeniopsis lanceolata]WOL37174.1 ribosomal protein S6 [Pachymeniopsis lanceolata]